MSTSTFSTVLLIVVLSLLLICAGAFFGLFAILHWAKKPVENRDTTESAPVKEKPPDNNTHKETPEEAERRRLIEDQNAFRILMNYSVATAYGMADADDSKPSGGDS